MTVEIRPPATADVALNAAFGGLGLTMQTEEFAAGRRRYVVWGRRGVAGFLTPDGRAFRRLPAEFLVEIRRTELDGDPIGDPVAREYFTTADVETAAAWVQHALDVLGQDVPAPEPAPIAPAPARPELPAADPRPAPAPEPPAAEDLSDPEETPMAPHSAPSHRRIRPGKQRHQSWPAELDVRLSGPERPDPAVRVWGVWIQGQYVGQLVSRRYAIPDAGWLHRHRTVWSAYYIRAAAYGDLTISGRESRKGALHVLVSWWMATFRGIRA